MHKTVYNTQAWRDLPRETCRVHELFGEAAGPCRGTIHHHHVDPDNPDSRTVTCCARHHPQLHRILRGFAAAGWRTCTHHHPYPEGRAACERRLNAA